MVIDEPSHLARPVPPNMPVLLTAQAALQARQPAPGSTSASRWAGERSVANRRDIVDEVRDDAQARVSSYPTERMLMAQKCERCGLLNPRSALMCDCGLRSQLATFPGRPCPSRYLQPGSR